MLFWLFIVILLSCSLAKKLYTYFANRRQTLNHVLFYLLLVKNLPMSNSTGNATSFQTKIQAVRYLDITFHSVACYELQKHLRVFLLFLVPELWHAQGKAIPQYLRIWVPASFSLWHQLSLPNIPQTQRSPEERGFLKYGVSLEEIILWLGACLYLSLHRCLISPILLIYDAASSDRTALLVPSGSFKLGSSAQSRILPLKKSPCL